MNTLRAACLPWVEGMPGWISTTSSVRSSSRRFDLRVAQALLEPLQEGGRLGIRRRVGYFSLGLCGQTPLLSPFGDGTRPIIPDPP